MKALVWLVYNVFLVGGTAYLVGWQDWSPWWFLLTALLLADYKESGND